MEYISATMNFNIIEFENAKELVSGIFDWYDCLHKSNFSDVINFIDTTIADIHYELDATSMNIKTIYSKLFEGDKLLPNMNFEYQSAYFEELHKLTKYAKTYAEALTLLQGDYVDAYITIREEYNKRGV